jgi:Ca2+-binding RTX toxin-like protein
MTLYIHELLCVDPVGNLSVATLTVEDDDNGLTSLEPDAVYTLDGTVLASAPQVFVGSLEVTLLNGVARTPLTMTFSQGGNDYYMIEPNLPVDTIGATGGFTSFGEVGGISYAVYGATTVDLDRPYQGTALIQTFDSADMLTFSQIDTVTVYDDDKKIQLTGETDGDPLGNFGYQGQEYSFNDSDAGAGDTRMVLVQVAYDGPAGAGTFEAILYTFNLGPSYAKAYIPRTGSVDLANVGTVTGVTVLATSLDGDRYSDFGLGFDTTLTNGTNSADTMSGTWLHDELVGKNGADILIGSMGEDKLYGGGGSDMLYGGMHADTLEGGALGDFLYGRSFDDSLLGQDGADVLFGGYGRDTISGGSGNDTMYGDADDDEITGGTGKDTIDGGDGSDTLTGNSRSDTFVFAVDGATDTITDFQDGSDLIDLTVKFSKLTITDIAPGEVHVTHSGEVLILLDGTGTLTSADLSSADFI